MLYELLDSTCLFQNVDSNSRVIAVENMILVVDITRRQMEPRRDKESAVVLEGSGAGVWYVHPIRLEVYLC